MRLVRGGAGTALVGGHDEVDDRIEEYRALGIEHFVLSGYPHLEEAYRFGEGVIPDLAARGLLPPVAAGRGAPVLVASGRRPDGSGVGWLTGVALREDPAPRPGWWKREQHRGAGA